MFSFTTPREELGLQEFLDETIGCPTGDPEMRFNLGCGKGIFSNAAT
jgi:hypothetical protein